MKLVLHVPRSSTVIPGCERQSLLLSDDELRQELLQMTDAYTDELFDFPGATTVRNPYSRLVADPERFADDAEEVMSKVGMGVIYTRTSDGQTLREPPSLEQREAMLTQYYRPHHQSLTQAAEEALVSSGRCLIVDAHSFPSTPLPYELDQNPFRPDICIGTDAFHTPSGLKDILVSQFTEMGYSVAVDGPFSGAIVPAPFYRKNKNVQSVMIELNRGMYMNESTGAKSRHFDEVRQAVSTALSMLSRTECSIEYGPDNQSPMLSFSPPAKTSERREQFLIHRVRHPYPKLPGEPVEHWPHLTEEEQEEDRQWATWRYSRPKTKNSTK